MNQLPLPTGNMTDAERRVAVIQAIEAFCAMATNHPDTPRHDWGSEVFFPDTPGQKVTRIVQGTLRPDGSITNKSVHCFIDNFNGDVFKAAGWKAPAKGTRYNLLTEADVIEANFYWSGRYLYHDYKRVAQ